MRRNITIEEVQSSVKEIIDRLLPGETLVIMENGRPVAKLVGAIEKMATLTPEQRERIAEGLRQTFGKWPGDETDEEIAAALKAMKGRR